MDIRCNHGAGSRCAIQSAIDALPPEGGRVIVPAGGWESGPLHLRSNLELHLEPGAEIWFSATPEDYLPVVLTRWEGVECYNYSPLIYGDHLQNVIISGGGTFHGNGQAWWGWKKLQQGAADRLIRMAADQVPVEKRIFGTQEDALRPSFLELVHSDHILLKDFRICEGPMWTIHPVYCTDVTIRSLTIQTTGPNTDGINPDSCSRVLIEDCHFSTGDDGIAINSGMNEDGWRVGRPCTDIEVRNCYFTGGHAAIAIGSGMSGGVDHISVKGCMIRDCERGIRIKSMRGRGGYVRDCQFDNLRISHVEKEAIQITMNYDASTVVPLSSRAPVFERLNFHNIIGIGNGVDVSIVGLEESHVRRCRFDQIGLEAREAGRIEYYDDDGTQAPQGETSMKARLAGAV